MAFTEFKPSIATWLQGALFLLTLVTQVLAVESAAEGGSARSQKITPKIFIFSMVTKANLHAYQRSRTSIAHTHTVRTGRRGVVEHS